MRVNCRQFHSYKRLCIVSVCCLLTIGWIIQDTTVPYGDVEIQLNSSKFIYVHQPIECRGNLVAIVTSATGNREHRDVIRRTWGRGQNVYFLLGDPKSEEQQSLIDTEAVEHNDIVQGSFEDIYRHLTFKTVFGYLWTRHKCNATYIVKLDDDCLVNMDAIKDYLVENIADEEARIICPPAVNYIPHRFISKWRVTAKEYPHFTYPDFCLGGTGVILNRKAVSLLLAQVDRTPFLWLEDVFTTGLLRVNAGIEITSLKAKTILMGPTGLKPKQVQQMWDLHRRRTLTSK